MGGFGKTENEYPGNDDVISRKIEEAALAFEGVRDRLWVQLVEKENGLIQSGKYPYKEVEGTDLVAVYQVREGGRKPGRSDPFVDNTMMRKWRADPYCLDWIALKSTMHQMPARITTLNGLFRQDTRAVNPEEVCCKSGVTYILTNAEIRYATAMLRYPGLLQALAENSGSDLYILPFSPHAMALRKVEEGMQLRWLQCLLVEINMTKEASDKILSNHVYRYDRKEQCLSCATTEEETREILKRFLVARGHGQSTMPEDDKEWLER